MRGSTTVHSVPLPLGHGTQCPITSGQSEWSRFFLYYLLWKRALYVCGYEVSGRILLDSRCTNFGRAFLSRDTSSQVLGWAWRKEEDGIDGNSLIMPSNLKTFQRDKTQVAERDADDPDLVQTSANVGICIQVSIKKFKKIKIF